MAELLVYDNYMDAEARLAVGSYLRKKWQGLIDPDRADHGNATERVDYIDAGSTSR